MLSFTLEGYLLLIFFYLDQDQKRFLHSHLYLLNAVFSYFTSSKEKERDKDEKNHLFQFISRKNTFRKGNFLVLDLKKQTFK